MYYLFKLIEVMISWDRYLENRSIILYKKKSCKIYKIYF